MQRGMFAAGAGEAASQAASPAQADTAVSERDPSIQQLLTASGAIGAIWLVAVTWRVFLDAVAPWDSKNQFYAFFRFLASSIHSGATPFWNPYHYGGHPGVADPQSLVFAPLFVLWALFDAAPSMLAFDLIVYAHLLAGGLALGVFGWRAGWPPVACVLAAVVFMFGAGASGRLHHTGVIVTYALFPPALLLLQLALQRRSIPIALGFAVVASALALGRNQVALLFCFVLAAAAVAEIVSDERPLRYLAARVPVLAVMAIAGVVLIAAPMLLTMQFAALSNRPHVVIERALEASLYPANLATLAVPNIFGSHEFPPWGPNYQTAPEVAAVDESFNYMFVGSVPVVLLLWFGIVGGWAWRPGRVLIASVLAVALLYMLGRYTPLFGWAFAWVPGVSLFRRPVDGSFVFLAALAILTGTLLTDYIRQGLPRRRLLLGAVTVASALAIVAWAVIFSARSGRAAAAAFEVLRMAPIPVLAVALLALARGAPARRWAAAGVATIAIAELLWWNAASRMNAEARDHYAVLEQPAPFDAAALEVLEREINERHRNGERPRVEIMGVGGPWQNLAVVRGLEAINGYNPLRIGIYDKLIAPGETTYLSEQRSFPASFDGYDCAMARALGLEYVVLDRPIEKVPHLAKRPAADLLHGGPRVWIYRMRNPMPRLAFATRFQVADADGVGRAGELLVSPSSDRVLFDDDTPPLGAYWSLPPGQGGSARIVSWRPDRIEIEAESPHGGMLALHETFYPGWIAEIDGKRSRILRADVLFRGLEVPAGTRRVVFRYAPFSLENLAGAWATVLHRPH